MLIAGVLSTHHNLVVPKNQKEAYKIDKHHWVKAELAELAMLKKRETWDLVELPVGKNVVRSRFTYAVKTKGDGEWYKDKARLLLKDSRWWQVKISQKCGWRLPDSSLLE